MFQYILVGVCAYIVVSSIPSILRNNKNSQVIH